MDFNATFTRRLFIPHPRIAGKQAEKEQDDLYHFKQKNSNISVNCLALAVCLYACHTNNFRRSLTFIFHITFLDEKKTETCGDIATVGIIFLKERERKKQFSVQKLGMPKIVQFRRVYGCLKEKQHYSLGFFFMIIISKYSHIV